VLGENFEHDPQTLSMSLAKPGHLAPNLDGEDFHVLDLPRHVEVLNFGFTIRRTRI
jgi:hypothetical protein